MKDGICFLFKVCYEGYENIVKVLLWYGVDINFCMKDGIIFFYIVC